MLIIGLGDVGAWALEFLAREPGVGTIAVADLRAHWGRYRTNLAAIGASMNGHDKSFEFHPVDLSDVSQTAEVFADVKPDVVINVSSLLSPRSVTEQLSQVPGEAGKQARAALTIGAQLPWHLAPAYNVMKARDSATPDTPVVNVSFADVVNPMLWSAGLGAVCGAGNCEHLAYEIRRTVADDHECAADAVQVFLVSGGSAMLHAGPQQNALFSQAHGRRQGRHIQLRPEIPHRGGHPKPVLPRRRIPTPVPNPRCLGGKERPGDCSRQPRAYDCEFTPGAAGRLPGQAWGGWSRTSSS